MPANGGYPGALKEDSPADGRNRKRPSRNKKIAEEALAAPKAAREKNARLEADPQVAVGKIAEMGRQAPIMPQPADPVATAASAAVVSLGEQTIKDLTFAVSSLARSSRHGTIAAGGLPGQHRAPSWCARCIVKGGWWRNQEHDCVTAEGRKKCQYCVAMNGHCEQIPKRLWGEARILIREIKFARTIGQDALLVTAAKGAKFAKKMRVANARNKRLAARPMGLVEQKLDQLIALVGIHAQLAMHDHGLRMEDIEDVLYGDDGGEDEPELEVSDAE